MNANHQRDEKNFTPTKNKWAKYIRYRYGNEYIRIIRYLKINLANSDLFAVVLLEKWIRAFLWITIWGEWGGGAIFHLMHDPSNKMIFLIDIISLYTHDSHN